MLTAEQLEMRKSGIGSSEIAAVVGVDPFKRPIDIYLDKLGLAEPRADNEHTDIGNELEDSVARMALKRLGQKTAKYGTTVRHPTLPIALATPDFILDPAAILETKSVGYRMMHHWDPDVSDDSGVPAYYLCQVQWQLEVVGVDLAHVAVLLGGRDFRVYRIERDLDLGQALLDQAWDFWTHNVIAREPPPVDGSYSADRWLQKRFSKVGADFVKATPEHQALVVQLKASRAALARAEKEAAVAEQRVKEVIGEAAGIESDLGVVTWKRDRWGRTSWKDVATEMKAPEDLIQKYRSQPERRFLVPRLWAEGENT